MWLQGLNRQRTALHGPGCSAPRHPGTQESGGGGLAVVTRRRPSRGGSWPTRWRECRRENHYVFRPMVRRGEPEATGQCAGVPTEGERVCHRPPGRPRHQPAPPLESDRRSALRRPGHDSLRPRITWSGWRTSTAATTSATRSCGPSPATSGARPPMRARPRLVCDAARRLARRLSLRAWGQRTHRQAFVQPSHPVFKIDCQWWVRR